MDWKDIESHKGKYQISDCGFVMNAKTKELLSRKEVGKLFTVRLYPYGYPTETPICQLVAQAFIDNPNNYRCIRYITKDQRNIQKDNLEWVEALNDDDLGYMIPDAWFVNFGK